MDIRVKEKTQMRFARIAFFMLTAYMLFLFNKEKVLSLKLSIVFSIYLISYVYYLYTRYRYGEKNIKLVVLGALLLTVISVVGLKFFVFK